jgi:hypothetical protein
MTKADTSQASRLEKRSPLRYQTTEQHDISRCERGRPPILGATCACGGTLFGKRRGDGYEFFAGLPAGDPHSFALRAPSTSEPG